MAVELNVRSELGRIITELAQIHDASGRVGDSLGDAGKKIGDGLNEQAKKTETFLERLRSAGGRTADQLVKDFKALASVNAIAGSLKFSEMFRGSIKETITLSDSIRKLGATLGITGSEMARFQSQMTKGFASIGLSSAAAANALGGLSGTPVRGQGNLLAYAQRAGMLASISGEGGQEGNIAAGLSRVVTAQGGNPNNQAQMKAAADDLLRIRQATGRSATEILAAMEQLFSGANKEFRQRLQGGGAVTLATAALVGGKDATGFLEKYLSSNVFQRFGANAQGLGGIVDKNGGLNLARMQSVLSTARGRGLGDEQAGLTTMGLSDEEAKGFIRLTEALKENQATVDGARERQVDVNKAYREAIGLGESFNRVLNKTKGVFADLLAPGTQGLTNILGKAGDSTGGALAATVGSGILASVLLGGGMRGLLKSAATTAGVEAATGRNVVPVFVTNFPAGGLGGLGGSAIPAALGVSGIAAVGIGLAAAGTGLLIGANEKAQSDRIEATVLKPQRDYDERQQKILEEINASQKQQVQILTGKNGRMEIHVQSTTPNIRATPPSNRGVSFGPRP